jgi:hypothetical protein
MKSLLLFCLALSGCGFGQTHPKEKCGEWSKWEASADGKTLTRGMVECPAEQPAPTQPQKPCNGCGTVAGDHSPLSPWITKTVHPITAEGTPSLLPCAPHCKFEVRTKTEKEVPSVINLAEMCREGFVYVPAGDFSMCAPGVNPCVGMLRHENSACVRITHELYLSGQLLGTLEEK